MAYVNPRSDVSVFYANSRSLVNKINQLELEIATYQYDLMVFTETHLDSSILDSELFPSSYTVFRRDRVQNGRRGSGILIAVRDTLRASVREDVSFNSELLYVDIIFPANRKLVYVSSIGRLTVALTACWIYKRLLILCFLHQKTQKWSLLATLILSNSTGTPTAPL